MKIFDKTEVRDLLEIEDIFELLQEWGGEPEYCSFGIISSTICHNKPGEGSKKLYYYSNTDLFRCYTGCDDVFDIFELTIKVANIQMKKEYDLNDAVRFIAYKFGYAGRQEDVNDDDDNDVLDDWQKLSNYERIQEISIDSKDIILKEYDKIILDRLNYSLQIKPWIDEGINEDVINYAHIGFFPGTDQITIPHYDKDNRFIGLRGRALVKEDAERYGKYRPIVINKQRYNHPLGMNLYNFNNSKNNIKTMEKVIVFEGEKSVLLYQSYFGLENDIAVACCGSSISAYQTQLLIEAGAKEIIVAFDRQFKEIGDKEFEHLTKNLTRYYNKYKNYINISFIFDKNMITDYKDSPIDKGKDTFLKLFKDRVSL